MFPGAVEAAEPMAVAMAGSCSVAPAGTDQLDLEAAEQLIQLSGGDNGAADDADAGSESRSTDSVKCRRKEKEAAVESRRRRSAARIIPGAGKDDAGNGAGEPEIKGVASSAASSATAADVVEKEEEEQVAVVVESCRRTAAAAERCPAGRKDRDGGGVAHGEARKRPRYRLLADVYMDTEPTRRTAAGGEGHAGRDPPEEGKRKKEKKRAAFHDGVVAAVDATASKARQSVQC